MRPELANAMRREVGRDDRPRRAVRNAGRLSAKSKFRGSRTAAADIVKVDTADHGYLRVPLESCKGLDISNFSYMDTAKGLAYLEEDVDAGVWLDANGVDSMSVRTIYSEEGDFIRRLPSFSRSARRRTASEGTCEYCGVNPIDDDEFLQQAKMCIDCGMEYSDEDLMDADYDAWADKFLGGNQRPPRTARRRTSRRKISGVTTTSFGGSGYGGMGSMWGSKVLLDGEEIGEYSQYVHFDGDASSYYTPKSYVTGQSGPEMSPEDAVQWIVEQASSGRTASRRTAGGPPQMGRFTVISDGKTVVDGAKATEMSAIIDRLQSYDSAGPRSIKVFDQNGNDVSSRFVYTSRRRRTAAADVDDWIDAVRNAIEEWEMQGNYVPGNLTEDDMRNWAENAILYAEGDYDTNDMMSDERTNASYDYLDDEGVFDDWSEGMESEARRRTAGNKGRRRRTALRRKMAMPLVGEPDFNRMEAGTRAAAYDPNNWTSRKAYDAIIALAKNPPQNAYYVAEATVRTMAENSDGPFGWDSVDREFAFWIMSDASGFPYGEILDAWLESDLGYGEGITARRRTNRNARKEATVNNRRIPTRRPSVAGRTPARRTVARRTVARRTPTGTPVARSGRRPVATRARTAGFARGTVVTLKREAARSRTPLTLRVVATRNGRFVGERLAARRPTGELWEFTSHEVARVVARTPQRRIAPPLARRRRYADQSTSTNFPGMAAPAPSAPAGETPTFDDANLMSPTADADGTEADWMDDPTAPITGAGDVSTTSPTATEYSGTPDELEAPVAGTDADITVDGEVVGLIAEDTGSSTVIPGDATEVTAGRRTEARFFAAQRLAQLRVEAGVMQGDPVVIGHQLVASKMSLNEMQSEIGTLDRVITVRGSVDDDAPRKVAKERKGSLVPRSSGRTVPSMVSAPSAPAVDGDDFALFE